MTVEPYEALEAELRALSSQLAFPATPDLAAAVGAELARRPAAVRRTSRWWSSPTTAAIAAGVVGLLALILVVSPGARDAVASIFRGVRGIRIVVDRGQPAPTTPAVSSAPVSAPQPLPTVSSTVSSAVSSASPSSPAPSSSSSSLPPAPSIPGTPATLAQVRAAVSFTPRMPPALGPPDRILFEKDVADGMVTMVWSASPQLPPAAGDIGAVLTQFAPGFQDDFPYWMKSVVGESVLRQVDVAGSEGTWVEGGHRLDFRIPDPAGWNELASSRIAANTLVWADDGVTYRLETALPLDEVLLLAQSMR